MRTRLVRRVFASATCAGLVGSIVLASWSAADTEARVVLEESGVLLTYGSAPSEFGQLWVPESTGGSRAPVVVLIHGGFWQRRIADLSIMNPLAEVLFDRGYAVWNIEYGRVGEREGGWPHTFVHVASALDHLVALERTRAIDASRVAAIGHSAGGQLAIWAGGRADLLPLDPGANPIVTPRAVIALAPVQNLELADAEGLGNDAVAKFLGGGADDTPERYRVAGVGRGSDRLVVVAGGADEVVPDRFAIDQDSSAVTLVRLDGADHFDLIDAAGPALGPIERILQDAFSSGGHPKS